MVLHPLPNGEGFNEFSILYMNQRGAYIEPGMDLDEFSDGREIQPDELQKYLKEKIVLPDGVTDVFIWVHGWRNNSSRALLNARRLFNGLTDAGITRGAQYPSLGHFVPAFIAIHWPSMSSPFPSGYKRIRDRARSMTDEGDAEFVLASLLGYLDGKNSRTGGPGSKTLRAKGGFYVHCLGHSFGGRFLTAAIRAAASPQHRTLSLLGKVGTDGRKVLSAIADVGFEFTVDSVLIFQMAAPRHSFGSELRMLIHKAPLRGPLVLTYSCRDRANCLWHRFAEWGEAGIGCSGAGEPKDDICEIRLGPLDYRYTGSDFCKRIVNVKSCWAFKKSLFRIEGAHSDFWYSESIHLAMSLAEFVRS